ncbi:HMG box domain-containing protein [Plasmodiophora brassicae]|uniref:HMG box domain-containing protein n=1 Tax=Plasmodiophora brassicae TaxID=37360 RepID=A0A0G4IRI8_PLABS|nr:hypothetical protein PBRA_005921 [Plasmodiophora brassicae]
MASEDDGIVPSTEPTNDHQTDVRVDGASPLVAEEANREDRDAIASVHEATTVEDVSATTTAPEAESPAVKQTEESGDIEGTGPTVADVEDMVAAVLEEVDIAAPDTTERSVRQRVMKELGVDSLSKEQKAIVKRRLEEFVLRHAAQEASSGSSSSEAELASGDEEIVQPKRKKRLQSASEHRIPKKRKTSLSAGHPKRPLSAFMYFSQEKRSDVKADNPETSFGDLGKILGQMWKDLSEDDKKPYVEKAAADKARYDEEVIAWRQANPVPEKPPSSASKPGKRLKRRVSEIEDDDVGSQRSSDDEKPAKKPMTHIDAVLASMKSRRRRRQSETTLDDAAPVAEQLLDRMRAACEADLQAFAEQKPAVQKIMLLDTVERETKKNQVQQMLLDGGVLRQFRDWLNILPDGSLPNLTLRTRLYALLDQLPIDQDLLLESEGLGIVLMALWKHKEETAKNKHTLRALIEKWTRPLIRADTDYRKIRAVSEREAAMVRNRHAKLTASRDVPMIRYQSHHAERPDKAIFDYTVRPVPRVLDEDDESAHRRSAEPSRMQRVRAQMDRLRRGKGKSRAVTVNISRR